MFCVIMPLCNRMFCCIFGWYFCIEIRLKYETNILLSSSRAFSLSTLWKTVLFLSALELFHCLPPLFHCQPLWTTVRLHGKKLQNAANEIANVVDLEQEILFSRPRLDVWRNLSKTSGNGLMHFRWIFFEERKISDTLD